MSDWTYVVNALAATRTQGELEALLKGDGADVSSPSEKDLGVAVVDAITCGPRVRLLRRQDGARLVYAMNYSYGWRILAVLDDDGQDRIVLQKAAGKQGPYLVGENVREVVRALADVLKDEDRTPQDFEWF